MKKILLAVLLFLLVSTTAVFANVNCKILDKINEPNDIKTLNDKQLKSLAKDIRAGILNKTNLVGGHVGPDLGVVELTIAMHYVFNSPTDKFIFDTSHQTYPHKMLTGRKQAFLDPLNNTNITGFSNFNESPHDFFIMGHTSTSISLAEGMAKARDLKGEKYNVIALIGDGSLSGGEALEGLNNAVELGSNFIIIVNDNEMCIAENHGGLYKQLKLLRETNGTAENNMFKALGYDYYYVENGNEIQPLIEIFNKVKDTTKPTIVHVHTLKGKGYIPAVENKERFHWILPGYMNKQGESAEQKEETYTSITTDYLLNKTKTDKKFITISPATPGAGGLTPEIRQEMGAQYTDVGIAEQHAVGYASGIAKNGGKPVLMVCSSFIQRAYDQLSQDVAINNSPAVILVMSYGISGGDVTHNGVFDIPLISNIPNIVFMSPSNKEEYVAILDWATKQNSYPVVIRVPQGDVISTGEADKTDYSKINKFKTVSDGSEIAIIAEGSFFELAKKLQTEIKEKMNIDATLINPVYMSGIDKELLESLKSKHKIVITLENGVLDGGFGEKIARFYSNSDMKVYNYGATKEFTDRVPTEELYKKYHLVPELIISDINDVGAGVNVKDEVTPNENNEKEAGAGVNVKEEVTPNEKDKKTPTDNIQPTPAVEQKSEIKEPQKVTDQKQEVNETKEIKPEPANVKEEPQKENEKPVSEVKTESETKPEVKAETKEDTKVNPEKSSATQAEPEQKVEPKSEDKELKQAEAKDKKVKESKKTKPEKVKTEKTDKVKAEKSAKVKQEKPKKIKKGKQPNLKPTKKEIKQAEPVVKTEEFMDTPPEVPQSIDKPSLEPIDMDKANPFEIPEPKTDDAE